MQATNVDVLLAIVRLETKLDNLAQQVTPKLEDHELRIRSLEKSRWPLPSLAVLVAVADIISRYWHR